MNKRWLSSLAFAALFSTAAWGLPQNPDVRHGNVQIQGTEGLLQVLQQSPHAIINWSQFNISPSEIVRFLQPSNGVALNRVTGNQASLIQGLLEANGKLILLNPNGILFTNTARVDVGGLLASTLSMTDGDFLANNYRLTQDPQTPMAAIVNQGTLKVNDGGYLVLVSPLVHNEGLIVAREGQIALGASTEASLSFDPEGRIEFTLPDGYRGSTPPPAQAGAVLLAPGQLTEVLAGIVAMDPTTEATALPGVQGLLSNAGSISVDGLHQAGSIRLDSSLATINTSSGSISASASALGGKAGQIEVFSAGTAFSSGQLAARGGPQGEGGFIELSALTPMLFAAPDISADGGTAGVFLLDPTDITIIESAGSFDGALPDISGEPGAGTVSVTAINAVTSGTIILQATNDILWLGVTPPIQLGPDVNLVMDAGGTIFANPANLIEGPFQSNVSLLAGGNINAPQMTDIGGEVSVVSNGGNVQIGGSILASQGVTVNAAGTITAGTDKVIGSPGNGNINLQAGGNIQLEDVFTEGDVGIESLNGNILLLGGVSSQTFMTLSAPNGDIQSNVLISPGFSLEVTAQTFLGPSSQDGFVMVSPQTNTDIVLNILGPNKSFPLGGTGAAGLVFSINPGWDFSSETPGGGFINPDPPNTGRVFIDTTNGPFDDGAPFPPANRINVAKYEPGGTPPPPPPPPPPPGPDLPEVIEDFVDSPEPDLRDQLLRSTAAQLLNLGNLESYYDVNPGRRSWMPVRNFGLRTAYNIPLYTLELATVQIVDPEEGYWRQFLAGFLIWEDEPDEEAESL